MDTSKHNTLSRFRNFKYFTHAVILIALILLYLLVQWLVQTFQKPGHMGVIESQSMEMTVQPPQGAMPVQIEIVKLGTFASAVTYTGSAVAYNDIQVFPRVEGWIQSMLVYPGDRIHQGQLLAQLDTKELTSRVREARFGQSAATQGYYASLRSREQAAAQTQRAQQAIQAARANLEYWQNEIQRARTLAQEEVITQEEAQREQSQFEAAQSQYNQALAELRAAQQGAASSTFQAQSQQAQSQQAAAAARTQEIIRSYTSITAPKSGVVVERLISPGTLVNPNTPILRVAQIHPIRVQANVAEVDLERIRIGNPVKIWEGKNKTGAPVSATVTAIFPMANLQTRTAIVEAIVPNTEERFIPGDFIIVDIQTGQIRDAISVSNQALVSIGQQQAVWVVQDGKAHLQYVTTGETDGQRTQIVSGLKAEDVVVTRGQRDLQEGVAVVPGHYGPEGLKSLPKVVVSNRLSPENQYQVKQTIGHYVLSAKLLTQPPRVGQNKLQVEIVSGPAMPMPTNNISLEITTLMPSMPTMPTPKPTVQKVGDVRFQTDNAVFSMPGLWQVNLTVKQGNDVIATPKIEVQVPE
ncbi:MAG: efflux RND transporter periplasmic adaptor subunit [Cyanobacteria bacterium]|nr:efflux RND transporter periplasmic adaptor subunit [Cyanobacteriota bacterium]